MLPKVFGKTKEGLGVSDKNQVRDRRMEDGDEACLACSGPGAAEQQRLKEELVSLLCVEERPGLALV